METGVRPVSRVLVGLLGSVVILAGSATVNGAVVSASVPDPGTESSSAPARQPAAGAAFAQPPSGTVKGRPAPAEPMPQTELPPPVDEEEARSLVPVGLPYPPTTIGGFDPATSVELPGERTVDTSVFLNANGTRTVVAFNGPIHYRDALGVWQKVDQTLEADVVSGTFRPKGVGVGLTLAANATGSPLVRLSVDSAHSVGYRLDGAASAGAWTSGAKAEYHNVRPWTDLELVALANGVKETLILKSASAPTVFTFPLTLNGVSASIDGNGDVVYTDSDGVEWARTPRGWMVDDQLDMETGRGAYSEGVTYSLVPFGGGVALRVTLDSAWLNDPAREFPVRVDPTTVTKLTDSDDTYVQTGYSANNSTETEVKIGTPTTTPNTAYTYLHFGGINSTYNNYFVTGAELDLYEVHSWQCAPRSWTVHNVTSPWSGSTVKASAQPSFTATPIVTASSAKGDTCGGKGWNAPNITSAVQKWTHGTANYGLTVRPGSASDRTYWKRFASYQGDPNNHTSAPRIKFTYSSQGALYDPADAWTTMPTNTRNGVLPVKVTNYGHDAWPANGAYRLSYHLYDGAGNLITFDGARTMIPTTVNPRQSITLNATVGKLPPGSYRLVWDMVQESVTWFSQVGVPVPPAQAFTVVNQAPVVSKVNSPADLAAVTTNRPTFSVTAADADNYPAGGALSYYFRICENPDAESPAATCVNSGWISSSSWTPPANKLFWRKPYYWHAHVRDSGGAQRNASWVWRFTSVVSDTSNEARFGADPYGINDGGVNVSVGSYVTSAVEAPVATVGPPLSVTRTYNSGDAKVGAFGTGWSSLYDMAASSDASGNVTVIHADGRKALYGKNPDGTYAASYGYYSTLASVTGGGWTLTDKGSNVYTFNAVGKLTSVKDAAGRQLTLVDNGAGQTTVTDVTSGRTLTLTWTGTHVTSVATPNVAAAGGPLVWRYYYTGDQLTAACDPRNNAAGGSCVTYTYAGTGGRLSAVTLPRGNTPQQIHYATDGTVDWRRDGRGKQWTYTRVAELVDPAGGMRITVLDPRNNSTVYLYDAQKRLVRREGGRGETRRFSYDTTTGFLNKITDENSNQLMLTVDDRGNVLSRSVPYGDVPGLVATSYYTYKYATAGDPTDNKLLTYRDARSSSATDNRYVVSYDYYATNGQPLTLTTPPTAAFPSGTTARWSYTGTGIPAVGSSGSQPAGLLAGEMDPRGYSVSYSYNSSGDLTRVVDRNGLRTDYAYDELGRLASSTVYPDNHPGGLTTSYGYHLSGVVGTETGPGVVDPRTNVTHTRRITYAPDANGIIRDTTVADLTGGDTARVTHVDVDENDNVTLVRDPEGGQTTRTYDDAGNVATITDPRGQLTQFDYDANNRLATVTAKGFVDDPINPGTPRDVVLARYTYDSAGGLDTVTDARGIVQDHAWTPDQRLQSITVKGFRNPDGTTRDLVTEWHRYDPAGNETQTKVGGYLRTINSTYNEAGWLTSQTEDPATINRTTTYVRDAAGNVTTLQRRQGSGPVEETRTVYDGGGNPTEITAENGAADLLTVVNRNNRGQVTGVYDPRGTAATPYNTTYYTGYTYDGLGQLLTTSGGAITAEEAGGTPTSSRSQWLYGYNTFGERTRVVDPRGKTYVTSYDKAGRPKVVTWPSYTPPGGTALTPTETYGYNAAGDLLTVDDRRGNRTSYDYDTLGRLVRRTQPKPDPAQANPVTRWTYDEAGNLVSTVDPTGARTEYGYDDLNQLRSLVDVVRNGTSTPNRYTTTFGYDDLGNRNKQVKPHLNETSYADYNAASELIQVQDAAGNLWQLGRDVAGRVVRRTDPIGRYQTTTFDLAGRATSLAAYNPVGVLQHTENATYDRAGNLASHTPSASGPGVTTAATRTYAFDAMNRLTSMVEPTSTTASITTSFGYDLTGNRTRITDGRGHVTTTSYTAWNLPETVVEPSTAAYPELANRQYVTVYDAGGLPVEERKPGSVTVARTFDALGRLTAETGGGAAGSRSLGYDLAGRLTSAGHPNGTQTFGYNDRGLLTSASGPAGALTNSYDANGRLTSRADTNGTTTLTWDPRDIPATITDPLTGVQQTLTYWPDAQLKTRQYGTAGPQRSYTYDDQGRLASDTMKATPGGATTYSLGYTYDPDGNVKTKTTGPAGVADAGTHTYDYDLADRLTSWAAPSGTTTYDYDASGNRTRAGTTTYTYNERNWLTGDSAGTSYTYTRRGTLKTQTVGASTTDLTFDAFDRLTADGTASYSYDALDRIATSGTTSFVYAGLEREPVSDGAASVARGPAGDPIALRVGTTSSAVVTDRHGDITAITHPTGGAVTGTAAFDPYGVKTATTGTATAFGYQGQWTSSTGRVHMQSRWYTPGAATFASRDTLAMSAPSGGGANRYAYGLGNPVTHADPTGHCVEGTKGCRTEALVDGSSLLTKVPPVVVGGVTAGAATSLLTKAANASLPGMLLTALLAGAATAPRTTTINIATGPHGCRTYCELLPGIFDQLLKYMDTMSRLGSGGGGGGGSGGPGGGPTILPKPPALHIAGPPPANGPGAFKPVVIDPLTNATTIAAAPAPAATPVTGPIANDSLSCGKGGTIARCASKQSALTPGCDLGATATMHQCEPVTPKTETGGKGGGKGGPPRRTAVDSCDEFPGDSTSECADLGNSDPYAGIKAASKYLQKLGVPRDLRAQILQSFEAETVTLETAGNADFALRFYGGSADALGRYLTPTFPGGNVRALLALPKENAASAIVQYQIQPGSSYIAGRVASNFGQPGGGIQYFVPHLTDLLGLG